MRGWQGDGGGCFVAHQLHTGLQLKPHRKMREIMAQTPEVALLLLEALCLSTTYGEEKHITRTGRPGLASSHVALPLSTPGSSWVKQT